MKVAIVTGASGGIGSATAIKLVEKDYFVIGQYNKNLNGINKIKERLEREGLAQNFFAIQSDFSDPSQVVAFYQTLSKSFKHVDLLVNNAGVGLYKLITETSEREWDEIFSINLKSVYLLTNLVLDGMIERRSGKIVNVSSIWGQVGASMEVAYSTSKSALIGYTKALAKEVAPSNINVNCVCPGVIDTPINSRFSKEEMQELADQTPLGRLGNPDEVADLIEFLGSEKSNFITGQIITCDGGFTL